MIAARHLVLELLLAAAVLTRMASALLSHRTASLPRLSCGHWHRLPWPAASNVAFLSIGDRGRTALVCSVPWGKPESPPITRTFLPAEPWKPVHSNRMALLLRAR